MVTPPMPVFVDLPADLAWHAEPRAEIWYLTCALRAGDRELASQAILTTNLNGRLFTSLSVVDVTEGEQHHTWRRYAPGEVQASTDALDVRVDGLAITGSMEGLELQATLDGGAMDLRCAATHPVVYANGTGYFPYFAGPTHQAAFPALDVTGTVTIGDRTHEVSGGGWFDRQWSESRDAFGLSRGFTWFGICLDDGHALSLWDTTGPDAVGHAWATVVGPDGTHVVTAVDPLAPRATGMRRNPETGSEYPDRWVLALPHLDTELVVEHSPLHDQQRFYSGVCRVAGRFRGAPASGYAFVDTVSHE